MVIKGEQMATILIETDLNVVLKQRLLFEDALCPYSVYIMMKEIPIYLWVNLEDSMVQYMYLYLK